MSTSMTLAEAIRARRSIGKVQDTPVDKNIIETILEAGNWAPSHHCTEPWRFFVMTGHGRKVLAEAYADIACEGSDAAGDELEALRAKQGLKAYRAPLIIAVAVTPSEAANVNRREELAAAHAAIQNMLLAAHASGLASIWRSGDPMYHPRMKSAFGLGDESEMVALIYLGYPVNPVHPGKRGSFEDKTVWISEFSAAQA
ncbi:nitroreductase family protein [Paenibacillus lutrae]|uniref:Putative NAD(P)H nitroreductase n=1 Tax=Paenibacillus lutrae TaxID=2078573 RepID=A0A7X3FJZ1_9BACL|nr:nitroreductase [Paenibacillus lutrae]MVP01108.1 nitroreductase [Paenibacillus lutrae]